jgi:integrase
MLWREVAGWPRGCSRTRNWRRCGSCDCARRRPPRCRRCPATTGTWAAIGKLLLYTGLRIEEVEALDLDDIVISARRGKVIVRDGKGGVYREVPLHRAARTALRAWLDERPQHRGAEDSPRCSCLGVANGCGCAPFATWSPNSVSTPAWCTSPATRTPASRGSTRTLRHTFGTQLLRNGVDIVVVADLMGHASLDTTRSYTRSSKADRARAIDQALITDE